jgi:hypothetical protein
MSRRLVVEIAALMLIVDAVARIDHALVFHPYDGVGRFSYAGCMSKIW